MNKNEKINECLEIKLNLIPPIKKDEIGKRKLFGKVIKAEIVLTAMLLGFFSVLLSFKYILNINLAGEANLNHEMEKEDQFGKIRSYNNQFSQANEKIKQVSAIDQSQLYWSSIFTKISQMILPGIEVSSFSTNNYTITISGIADTRDNLLTFKNNLEKEKCFSQIDLPLSNLVNKVDVAFQIVFNINEKCLKKNSNQ